MGGYWRPENGVILDGPSRWFHEIYLFPLPLGQPWHCSALSQKGIATTDRLLCGEEQRQVGAVDRTSEGADATTAHQVRPHQAIFHCSWQGVSSFQVPPSSFSKATRGKGHIFVGPQVKKIIECGEFAKLLNRKQKTAWNSFAAVVHGFLGSSKAENYVQMVQTLIKNCAKMGCRMSLKVLILDVHLDKFKENMGA